MEFLEPDRVHCACGKPLPAGRRICGPCFDEESSEWTRVGRAAEVGEPAVDDEGNEEEL